MKGQLSCSGRVAGSKVLRIGLDVQGMKNDLNDANDANDVNDANDLNYVNEEMIGKSDDWELRSKGKKAEVWGCDEKFAVSWWKKERKDLRERRVENRSKLGIAQRVLENLENCGRKDRRARDLKELAAVWIQFLMGDGKENALRSLARLLDRVEQDTVGSTLLLLAKVWGDWAEGEEVFEALHNVWRRYEWTHIKILILISHLSSDQIITFSTSLLFLDILEYSSALPTESLTWLSVLLHVLPSLSRPSLALLSYKSTVTRLQALSSSPSLSPSCLSCLSVINFLTH